MIFTLFDQDYVTACYGEEQRKEGRKEGRKETAANMLAIGMSIDIIQKVTGLTEAEINTLGKENKGTD